MTVNMDRELVRAVRDAIAADVDKFEMASWFGGEAAFRGAPATEALDACGTTACLAGHAVVQYAKLHNKAWVVCGDDVRTTGFSAESVAVIGRRVLSGEDRLTNSSEAWGMLFGAQGWPQHYRDMIHEAISGGENSHAAQAKAAIDLLDDILDEITVWRETTMTSTPCVPGCHLCVRSYVVQSWVYLPGEAEANADA